MKYLRRQMVLSVVLAVAGWLSLPSSTALADELARFDGQYRVRLSHGQVKARIEKAIETATKDMFFVARGIAEGRLEAKSPPIYELSISTSADQITVRLGNEQGHVAYTAPKNGGKVKVKAPDGEQVEMFFKIEKGSLLQLFANEDGVRENSLMLSEDGQRLVMRVSIRSERLSAPAVYTLPFERVSAGQR